MNLVDTPGTNVILQRQQRLTEEFVPRADLVLFVLSADRALTESEVYLHLCEPVSSWQLPLSLMCCICRCKCLIYT
jgi:predicted GTPase